MKSKRTKSWGPWKYEWYSICSTHFIYNETCLRCEAGTWRNSWYQYYSDIVYYKLPALWKKLS